MTPTRATAVLCSSLLLSCALVPAETQASSLVAQDPGGGVIRFGDAQEHAYRADFFPGAQYDPAIATPDSFLGQQHGSRLARHEEVLTAFRAWAETSDRITLETTGRTHEGRELVVAVVTSPENHGRLEEIRSDIARIADPRGLSGADGDAIVKSAPAVAWLGYSIHGDELSGTDASMAVAYHLVASQDDDVALLLDELVILIDPCLNPDGRERILGMVEQSAGYTPNLDYASMHRGHWPYGRGNHYLFDMNRDWMAGTQPETRARWRAALSWNPQLFVDAHEMGSLDTFLFYPQAEPRNPELSERLIHWQSVFGDEAGSAFDRHGWSYYTREWADAWGPFYSDAWGSLTGAIGILYEQAATYGSQLRRASGELLTYREAVHHQVTASYANLNSLRTHRSEILADYLANKRANVGAETEGNDQWLAVRYDGNVDRMNELMRVLSGQGIEYDFIASKREMRGARGARGEALDSLDLPKGTLVAWARQPQRQLLRAYFEFDPRMDESILKKEREELERRSSSKMYDITSWSLPHAYDLDAWWGTIPDLDPATDFGPGPGEGGPEWMQSRGPIDRNGVPDEDVYGWVVDGKADNAVVFATQAMETWLQLHASDRDFEVGQRRFSRGSLLIRRGEQEADVAEVEQRIAWAAEQSGATAVRISSGRAPGDGPDLGGGHFQLLARPRVAVIANAPVSTSSYGHLWHHLDTRLGVPFSIIDAHGLSRADLRRYNVLILPPGGLDSILRSMKDRLDGWMRGGGTLIAVGGTARNLTSGSLGLSSVTLRRHALDELDVYERAVGRERSSHNVEIDPALVWTGEPTPHEGDESEEEGNEEQGTEDETPLAERDAWMRRFSPSGANLLAEADLEHWLTIGCGERLPVMASGSSVFLTKSVATPVRYVSADDLRLGGLLWPEARERISDSAYLTRESRGNGQLILFAGVPAFRGYHLATGRLFSNAVIYGPGLGADQPVGW
jgi:hypothetical protein